MTDPLASISETNNKLSNFSTGINNKMTNISSSANPPNLIPVSPQPKIPSLLPASQTSQASLLPQPPVFPTPTPIPIPATPISSSSQKNLVPQLEDPDLPVTVIVTPFSKPKVVPKIPSYPSLSDRPLEIPPTSSMLNAVRDKLINIKNPATMARNVFAGLKKKEEELSSLDHNALASKIKNYLALETSAYVKFGENLSKMFLGVIDPKQAFSLPQITMPISIGNPGDEDPNIYCDGTAYMAKVTVTAGTFNLPIFTYKWSVVSMTPPGGGEEGTASFYPTGFPPSVPSGSPLLPPAPVNTLIGTTWNHEMYIVFTKAGFYNLQFKITCSLDSSISIAGRLMIPVIDRP